MSSPNGCSQSSDGKIYASAFLNRLPTKAGGTTIIDQNSFFCDVNRDQARFSPAILRITIKRRDSAFNFDIDIGGLFNFTIQDEKFIYNPSNIATLLPADKPTKIEDQFGDIVYLFDVQLKNVNDQNPPYNNGDIYRFNLNTNYMEGGGEIINMIFIRDPGFRNDTTTVGGELKESIPLVPLNPPNNMLISKQKDVHNISNYSDKNNKECINVLIPSINILGQTSVNRSDIGDVVFTIQDKFQYYDNDIPKHENKCGIYYINPNKLKTTTFHECCPKIVSVVKGKGSTLYAKLSYTFFKLGESKIGVPLTVFYPNIFLYAMLKYILARILYGEFNIKFLLEKYNDQFLDDLRHSRFFQAIQVFEDCNSIVYNYNKYFKYE